MEQNLARIRRAIAAACERARRSPEEVRLVAVTKEVGPELIRWAVEAGVEDLGENYVQELERKRQTGPPARWHFVGTMQSHTAHRLAEHADVVHTLVPGRAPHRLADRASKLGRKVPALVQVDFTERRFGARPEEVPSLLEELRDLQGLEVRGLMTLPPMPERPDDSRPAFQRLRQLRDGLRRGPTDLPELSMGMSADYEVAVEEGATMVRIGTALFGERPREPAARREPR